MRGKYLRIGVQSKFHSQHFFEYRTVPLVAGVRRCLLQQGNLLLHVRYEMRDQPRALREHAISGLGINHS